MARADAYKTDAEKRMDILEGALNSLNSDVEELREQLRATLPPYEKRVEEFVSQADNFELLDNQGLRRLFELETEGYSGTLFGPRIVALLAEDVEAFVDRWLRASLDGERTVKSREEAQAFQADYHRLRADLESLQEECKQLEASARQNLESEFEELLSELDTRREDDLGAVQELVNEGSLTPGQSAKHEKADLWEQQRRIAEQVQTFCDDISQHLSQGLATSLEGFAKLLDLLARSKQAMLGAHPKLSQHLNALHESEAKDLETVELDTTADDDSEGATTQLDSTGDTTKRQHNEQHTPRDTAHKPTPAASANPVETHAVRIYEGWASVDGRELFIGVGAPILTLCTLATIKGLSASGLLDLSADILGVLLAPYVIGGLFAWLIVVPAILGWSPRWTGWRFEIIERAELEQRVPLIMTPQKLRVGTSTYQWSALREAKLTRWEAQTPRDRGWRIDISPEGFSPVIFVTRVDSRDAWLRSDVPAKSKPDDAWRVNTEVFEQLKEFLEKNRVPANFLHHQSTETSIGANS
jgi:hypothetical protein